MLKRARLVFLAAVVVGAVVLATELPLGQLVHARSASVAAAVELKKVRSENKALARDVHLLRRGSTIEQIAHEEYGLVEPGERSVVVMPAAAGGKKGAEGASQLRSEPVPRSDLVPTDQALSPTVTPSRKKGPGFWSKVLDRLEFWKASP